MSNKNITILDIAKSVGVSKTTISRYLNGKYEYMSADTRERIKKVIEVTGFQPNKIAQSLKSQKSMLIGFVIADIESPFSSAAIKSVGNAMLGTDYNLIIANSDNSFEREQEYIQSLLGQQVDGLIVNTVKMNNPALISLANNGLPIVLLDRFVNDYKFDISYFENDRSVTAAMNHLEEMGYSHIALCTQPHEEISPRNFRREIFLKRLKKNRVENPERFVFVEEDEELTINNIKRLMDLSNKEGKPPAIICTNSVTLLRTVKAARTLGLRMPDDIGICGFDEWGWASELGLAGMIDVGLTTLTPSMQELGKHTAELLLRRIKRPEASKKEIAVPAQLVVRNSTRLKKENT
ncbi:LacI family DNA-binding transcriptional regulator [Neobacillus niacini]|uniref:LacI family DNA-binding transcriptional regulator n=1 Tax=Neobacillus niacini TaxID=86668 RepID=UPI002FFD8C27